MLELSREYHEEIVAHAREDDPDECCGILAGQDGKVLRLYRMTNVEHSPYRYSMDTKELYTVGKEISDREWELMAIYHSHTHTEAHPSQTDVRLATYPDAYYILVSLMDKENPAVRAFHIEDGTITEQEMRVVDA